MEKRGVIGVLVLLTAIFVLGGCATNIIGEAKRRPGQPASECSDQIDNDGDGYCDVYWKKASCKDGTTPGDSGCESKEDNDETNCGDGICEGGETATSCRQDCASSDTCSDTDGGNKITVFGTTSGYYNGKPYSNDDYCANEDYVMEYFCVGDYEKSQEQICGLDGLSGPYCLNSSVYRNHTDYFCSDGECDHIITPEPVEDCEHGCNNGQCLQVIYCGDGTCDGNETCETCEEDCGVCDSCTDSDGGIVLEIKGTISGYQNGNPYKYTDYCNSSITLQENFCSGNSPDSETYICNISCSDGACT